MTPFRPDPALCARFQADMAALLPNGPRHLGLAVSGGPDSLALLLLAHASLPNVSAATMDHGLRAESADEARHVAALCAQLGVPHQILHPATPPKGNISSWARDARYAALEKWAAEQGVDALATAHHADDQLETLLMRLNRGAGVAGLAGIRPRLGALVRPLLGWTKAELIALVKAAGIVAAEDPSNSDDRFDRARMRKALDQVNWLDARAAARSAAALAEADRALDWATAKALAEGAGADAKGRLTIDPEGLPQAIRLRLLRACLARIHPDAAPRDDEVLRLLALLEAGRTATLAGVKAMGGARWTFVPAPPRRITRNS
ncbi:MAG: tRNA lysidine(34) synthetase TilS [Chakrabartia sp.]